MFKRIIAMFITGVFLLMAAGCGSSESASNTKPASTESAASNITPTAAPETAATSKPPQQNPWTNEAWLVKANMPEARRCKSTVLGDKIYTAWANAKGNILISEYDIKLDYWRELEGESFTENAGEYAFVGLDDKLYVMGGFYDNKALCTLEEYDLRSETWLRKADMPIPKDCLGAAAVNGKLYAIGGNTGSSTSLEVEEYDPQTDTWVVKSKMQYDKIETGITVLNNKIYVSSRGGSNSNLEVYDPATDTWTVKAGPPTPRASFNLEAANGKIYTIGGCVYSNGNIDSVTKAIDEYDPTADKWVTKGERPGENWLMGTAAYDNKIYVMGGMIGKYPNGDLQDVLQVYDPQLDK